MSFKLAIPIVTFSKSGGMRVLEKLADNWIKMGNSVDFIVADTSTPYYPTNAKIINLNANQNETVEEILVLSKYLINHWTKYNKIIANGHVSVYPIFIAALMKWDLSKIVYYIQAYETEFYNDMPKGFKQLIRKTGTSFTYMLPIKQIVNANIYCNYKNIHTNDVVYPGLDLKLYYHKDPNLFNDILKVGCIGRPSIWKGTYDVCEAIKILKKEKYHVEFYIAFFDIDIVEHVFVKPDGDKNLASFYRDMDIIVAPGHIQLGSVHYPVIEAMACGTSVITTGYYPANENNAYIVPIKSPQSIADRIKEISFYRDVAIKKRINALSEISKFSWTKVSEKFMEIISS